MALIEEKQRALYESRIGVSRGSAKPAQIQDEIATQIASLTKTVSKNAFDKAVESGKIEAIDRANNYEFQYETKNIGGQEVKVPIKHVQRNDLGKTGNIKYWELMDKKRMNELENVSSSIVLTNRNKSESMEESVADFDKNTRADLSLFFNSLPPEDRGRAKIVAENQITNAKFYVDKTHQRAEVTRNTAELGKEITGILFSADDVLLNEDNLSYDILKQDVEDAIRFREGTIPNNKIKTAREKALSTLATNKNVKELLGINLGGMFDRDNINRNNLNILNKIKQAFENNFSDGLKIGNKEITREQLVASLDGNKVAQYTRLKNFYTGQHNALNVLNTRYLHLNTMRRDYKTGSASAVPSKNRNLVLDDPEFASQLFEEYLESERRVGTMAEYERSGEILDFHRWTYKTKGIRALPSSKVAEINGYLNGYNVDGVIKHLPLISEMANDLDAFHTDMGFDDNARYMMNYISQNAEINNASENNVAAVITQAFEKRKRDVGDTELRKIFSGSINKILQDNPNTVSLDKSYKTANDLFKDLNELVDSQAYDVIGAMAYTDIKNIVLSDISKSLMAPNRPTLKTYIANAINTLQEKESYGKTYAGFSLTGYEEVSNQLNMDQLPPTIMKYAPEKVYGPAFADGGLLLARTIREDILKVIEDRTLIDSSLQDFALNLKTGKDGRIQRSNLPVDPVLESLSEPARGHWAKSNYKLYPNLDNDGTVSYTLFHVGKNKYDPMIVRDSFGDPIVFGPEYFSGVANALYEQSEQEDE